MNTNTNLFLVGEGWGFDCAKTGLLKRFNSFKDLQTKEAKETINNLTEATIIFAGYKPIVPHDVLKNNDCINIHYSLLPKYRGLHSTVWAILNDEDYLGLSVHKMSDYIDDGPIIHQFKVKNDRIKTSTDYMLMFNQYIADNLGDIITDYFNNPTSLIENNKQYATWVGKRTIEDCKIDFGRDIKYIHNLFRALVNPYPLPYIIYREKKFIVSKVDYHLQNVDTHLGRILNIDNDGLWVKAKDGYIVIKELKDDKGGVVPFDYFKIGQYFNQ